MKESEKYPLVSLKQIFVELANPPINIQGKILQVLSGLTPSQQLKELERLSRIIRKENSIRINKVVSVTKNKYPKKYPKK